jgi:putative copper export protein
MIASSFGDLLVRAVEMSGQPLTAVFLVLPTVVFHTHLGHIWLIRIAALILLAVMVKAGSRYRDSRGFLYLILGVGLVVSMTMSATGHAADAGDFSIPEVIDWLHLLATLAWGGGLLVLSLRVLPEMVKQGDQAAPLIARVAGRFSRIAGFAVVVVALTAGYNAVIDVGNVAALLKAPYGRIIIVKAFLFFLLLILGAFNRYINVPLLREWEGAPLVKQGIIGRIAARCFSPLLHGLKGHLVALRIERCLRAEAILLAGVLLCATMLRHQIPARHFFHLQHAQAAGVEHVHHAAT